MGFSSGAYLFTASFPKNRSGTDWRVILQDKGGLLCGAVRFTRKDTRRGDAQLTANMVRSQLVFGVGAFCRTHETRPHPRCSTRSAAEKLGFRTWVARMLSAAVVRWYGRRSRAWQPREDMTPRAFVGGLPRRIRREETQTRRLRGGKRIERRTPQRKGAGTGACERSNSAEASMVTVASPPEKKSKRREGSSAGEGNEMECWLVSAHGGRW